MLRSRSLAVVCFLMASNLPVMGAASTVFPANVTSAAPSIATTQRPATSAAAYPIYSSSFRGNTPFHHTVAQLMAAGAKVLSSTIAANYWGQGIGQTQPAKESGGSGPLYLVHRGDPAYRFTCNAYGACNAAGMYVHFPWGANPQTGSDHHLATFDPVYLGGEVDGWGGDGNPAAACNLKVGSQGTASCSWGGFFPFSGNGLESSYSSGNAGGYALGLFEITAQELLQGHIDHALGIQQSCLDNGGVYPSVIGRKTDSACPWKLEPNAVYGDLIHLKSWVNIGQIGDSPYCRVILQALQTYGAYTADNNGGWGIALSMETMGVYPANANPWYQTIFPSMDNGDDGTGSGSAFAFRSCLQRIPASYIEVIQISPRLP